MRKLLLIAALSAGLGACSQAAEESDEPATAAATETPAVAETAATAPADGSAGTYEFTLDGKATTSVLKPDGTYEDTQDGKVTEKGLWADRDGKVCFDPEGDDTLGTCFTMTEPGADGTFTATSDDGTVLTIRKTA
jgi:hypothetical protein